MAGAVLEISLNAVIVTLLDGNPSILRVAGSNDIFADALPCGAFDPVAHPTLETGLRNWVSEQTGLTLGYCQQLYTFADRDRQRLKTGSATHLVSVGYLALTQNNGSSNSSLADLGARWKNWYAFFPWEDWRTGRPQQIDEIIVPALKHWANNQGAYTTVDELVDPNTRIHQAFGLNEAAWDETLVVERFELMYAAGLVEESLRDGHYQRHQLGASLGVAMAHDHRRILATAIAGLRGKLKYNPVLPGLLAEEFTLTGLQKSVENISGRLIHKQNFRRQVNKNNLVEPVGKTTLGTGGRSAALFRFRNVL